MTIPGSDGAGGDHVVADQSAVFAFLENPATHGGAAVTRIDTHGAAVFLAGDFAYKVKRAVLFPFMDFSTLEKRRAACTAEVEVSGAGAPGLYLGVSSITRTAGGFALGGEGEAVEYAVKMRRFDTGQTLDKVAERDAFTPGLARDVAAMVIAAHAAAPVRRGFDTAGRLAAYVEDNIREFTARPELFPAGEVESLATRAREAIERLRPLLRQRSAEGFVRRCHGDMHLRNIVLLDGKPVLFDAIEFSEDIATCDVLYDLAFLLMDLWQREVRHLPHALNHEANEILNRYLWEGPDAQIDGLAALAFFISLRAGIRAKVEAAGLAHLSGEDQEQAERRATEAFSTACALLAPPQPMIIAGSGFSIASVPRRPTLIAVGGLSGSGKSTFAMRTAPIWGSPPGAVVLRSDIERKRMFGVKETDRLPPAAYMQDASDRVYERLRALAARVLATGWSVIVDAVHARPSERDAIEDVAKAAGARFTGYWLEVPESEMIRRVEARTKDASDADAAVVRQQMSYDLGEIRWQRTSG